MLHDGGYMDLEDSFEDMEETSDYEDSGNRRLVFKQDRGWHTLIVRKTRVHDAGIYSCIASVGRDTDMSSAHLKIESE